jgi:hypothetical protein
MHAAPAPGNLYELICFASRDPVVNSEHGFPLVSNRLKQENSR